MQALRLARPTRSSLGSLLRAASSAAQQPPAAATTARSSTASVAIPLSNIEAQWDNFSAPEKMEVFAQLEELQKKDWRTLSVDEKKAVYYVNFGPHGPRKQPPPGTNFKVFLGTMAAIGVSGVLFYFIRSLAPPPPRTMTREWQEESNRRAIEQKQNPISGVASEGYKGKGHVQSR